MWQHGYSYEQKQGFSAEKKSCVLQETENEMSEI
jgi:hypothetical protein